MEKEKITFYVVMIAIILIVTTISLLATKKKKKKPFCQRCGSSNVKDVGWSLYCYNCNRETKKKI
jgi:NADH pyrophosphatase NudC (nudix superfamily)